MASEASVEPARFEVVRRLAAGGMGEVLLGRQRMRGGLVRTVVLKSMLPHMAESRANIDLFLREARLASSLSHPNIVQILDVTEHQGNPCIVMEYLRGADLGAILRRASKGGRWPSVSTTVAIVAQAADGLNHAHTHVGEDDAPRSIVHRDVSPQNIFVTRDGVVKVVDFGIARAEDDPRTQTGVLRGKIAYMAPEQLDGSPRARIGPAVDQFALGVVLWECLAKRRLYQRPSPIETMKAVVSMPVPPPSSLSGSPKVFDAIVLRALARHPRDRWPSCADLAAALRTAARGLEASSETDLVRSIVSTVLPDATPTPISARVPIDGSAETAPASRLARKDVIDSAEVETLRRAGKGRERGDAAAADPDDVIALDADYVRVDPDADDSDTWLDTYVPPSTESENALLAPPPARQAGRRVALATGLGAVAIALTTLLLVSTGALGSTPPSATVATTPEAVAPVPADILVRSDDVPADARIEVDGLALDDGTFRGPASDTPHHVRVMEGDRVVWSADPAWTSSQAVTVVATRAPEPAPPPPPTSVVHDSPAPHGHARDSRHGLVRDYPAQ